MNWDKVAELPHGEAKAEAISEMKRRETEEFLEITQVLNIHLIPKVYLISQPSLMPDALAEFQMDENVAYQMTSDVDAENLVEMAGRLCYMSFDKPRPGGNQAYLNHILEVGHGSVLEHAVFGMIFTGVSRSLTHELVRHRAGMSYSQLSQRYVDEAECEFVLPPNIPLGSKEYFDWTSFVRKARNTYADLVETLIGKQEGLNPADKTARRKKAREAARSVLPNCTATKIFVTGNARAWRNFIELRGSVHADAEIQMLAASVMKTLRDAAPNIFGDYTLSHEGVQTIWKKV